MSLGVEYGCPFVLTGPDGTRAVFNDDTDEDFVGVLSAEESSGLDSPDVREDIQARAEADGAVQGNNYFGARPVVLTGTIIATSKVDRNEKVARLKRASLALREDAKLEWAPAELQEEEEAVWVYLNVRRQQPLRVTKGYTKHFQLPLVAANASILSALGQEKDASLGMTKIVNAATWPTQYGVAVSSTTLYVPRGSSNSVQTANLDGSSPSSFTIGSLGGTYGIDVDSTYAYVTSSTTGYIARVLLNGTSPTEKFIDPTPTDVRGVAVNATHVYWTAQAAAIIGRATIAGASVENEFIEGCTGVHGIALSSTHIYWAETTEDRIGRSKLDGTEVTHTLLTNLNEVRDVAVYGEYLYFSYSDGVGLLPKIGRYKLDGSETILNYVDLPENGLRVRGLAADATYLYITREDSTYRTLRQPVVVNNEGDAITYPLLKINLSAKYLLPEVVELVNRTTGQTITLKFPEEENTAEFYIDLQRRTVYTLEGGVADYSWGAYIDFANTEWWGLEPGANEIEARGVSDDFVVEFQDAWL